MRRIAGLLALILATGCSRPTAEAGEPTAGRALEAAARQAGMMGDSRDAAGVYAAGENRLCVARRGRRYDIGVSVDYGVGQRCVARGSAGGRDSLTIDFGTGCRFTARRDGDLLAFPTRVPDGCASLCQGRAALDGLMVERLSEAAGEAARLRGADGELLCGA
ncbi:hypothetical protein [Sphingomonas endophytica]|uniref:Lipoprotein n=1 Tax=Sphingomonas endophytica TaxID=869719 RepID=A0A147IA86_9SPHN|nr:hypothetical protein [Sphingomonas endophytica]KTT76788.1 hypothetical protein NS334_00860 [Sphingomonas endophytica]